jgi:hypothetical protein
VSELVANFRTLELSPFLSFTYYETSEVRFAAMFMGADVRGLENCIDEGHMWDHPLIDPSTIRVASVFTPVGPWAKCKPALFFNFSNTYRVYLQLMTWSKAKGWHMRAHLFGKILWCGTFLLFEESNLTDSYRGSTVLGTLS